MLAACRQRGGLAATGGALPSSPVVTGGASPTMMFSSTRTLRDKSMFAAKRRVILPLKPNPQLSQMAIKYSFTTDPLKESDRAKFASVGDAMKEVMEAPENLEGEYSRRKLFSKSDPVFENLVEFIRGAEYNQMIRGRRFQKIYDAITEHDDVFVWLCMTAMAVLNPGDMRSRLIYRHLEALAKAVACGEMTQRTAFRFYESAVRSPAYKEIAQRQLESGAATRLAGLSAAAEVMRTMGATRRPMSSYFELFQRISERSEAMTPWGFPPLFQFEERLQLEPRLKFFSREAGEIQNRRRKSTVFARSLKMKGPRIMWLPPSWRQTKRYMGAHYVHNPGVMPD